MPSRIQYADDTLKEYSCTENTNLLGTINASGKARIIFKLEPHQEYTVKPSQTINQYGLLDKIAFPILCAAAFQSLAGSQPHVTGGLGSFQRSAPITAEPVCVH